MVFCFNLSPKKDTQIILFIIVVSLINYLKSFFYVCTMTEYRCRRCGHIASTKDNIIKHFKRKKLCNAVLEDIPVEELLLEYPVHVKRKEIRCDLCDTVFSFPSALYRHKKICEVKCSPKIEQRFKQLQDQITVLQNENKALKATNNTIGTQNINQGNIVHVNNIQINTFGNEDISHITSHPGFQKFMVGCIKGKTQGVCDLLIKKHFDKNHPENNNIKKLNKKDNFIEIFKNGRWNIAFCDEVLETVLDKLHLDFANFVEQELYSDDGLLKTVWVDNFMKEVGAALNWDLSAGEYEFDAESISEEKKKELKKRIYMMVLEHVYRKSREIYLDK